MTVNSDSDHPRLIPNGEPPTEPVDLAIVGAGPVGLFAAFYAGMRGMSVKVLDSHDSIGGQLSVFYPEQVIYDVAGYPGVVAADLVAQLDRQAQLAQPRLCLGEAVQSLNPPSGPVDYWQIGTDRNVHPARAVVLAVGAGRLLPKRLTLPSAKAFEGQGVYYRLADLPTTAIRRLLVAGQAELALSAARTMASAGCQVTLLHRRPSLLTEEAQSLRRFGIDVRPGQELADLHGSGSRLTSAVLRDCQSNQEEELPIDALLYLGGHETSLRPIQSWGLTLKGTGIEVQPTMQTNLPRVYAAGDVAVYPGKIKLLAVGFAEAATAVNHAYQSLHPDQKLFPGYSTSVAPKRLPGLRV